ncbi:MAG: hypothetical protein QOJ42_7306, partial [Acidobacteriaceae bacterium]|nr:hypothetical protein [Acidobacteriaceae bacterium]
MVENSIILDEFEHEWQGGQPPVLIDYLARLDGARLNAAIDDSKHQELAWELIRRDLYWRIQAGESGSLAERYFNLRGVALSDDRKRALADVEAEWRSSVPHGTYSTVPSLQLSRGARDDELDHLPRLGEGGMGIVYGGPDPVLERDVAIKVLKRELHPREKERFISEAHILARLEHPGIVPIHALGFLKDGRPYFAMKVVRGETLARLLKKRTAPADDLPRFIDIFEQVCQTIAYAHTRDVLHRDLKPGNVMVGAFRETQVMDWGLGKLVQPEPSATTGATASPPSPSLTAGPLGTYPYMAPEQARGQSGQIDARTDVFGLGGILCEILTGHPPYREPELQQKAVDGNLSETGERLDRCGADAELVQITRACLAVEPWDRPPDAGFVANQIAGYRAAVARRLEEAKVELGRTRIRRWTYGLGFGLVGTAALILVFIGFWQQEMSKRQQIDRSLTETEIARQQTDEALKETKTAKDKAEQAEREKSVLMAQLAEAHKALRRNSYLEGAQLAWLSYQQRKFRDAQAQLEGCFEEYRHWEWHHLMHRMRQEFVTLEGPGTKVEHVVFSPDGGRVVSARGDGPAKVWQANSGKLLLTLGHDNQRIMHVDFSPEGRRLVTAASDGKIEVWESETGKHIMTLGEFADFVDFLGLPIVAFFSPDGRFVAAVANDTMKLWRVDGGDAVLTLRGTGGHVAHNSFSPDGMRFCFPGEDGSTRIWLTATGKEALRIGDPESKIVLTAFSPDGQYLVSVGNDDTLKIWRTDTGKE